MNSINPTNISGLSSMRASAPNVATNKSASAQEQVSAQSADSFAQTSVDSEAALNVNLAKLREQVGGSKVEGSVSAKCGECDPPTASQEADHLEQSAEKREMASARGEQAAQRPIIVSSVPKNSTAWAIRESLAELLCFGIPTLMLWAFLMTI